MEIILKKYSRTWFHPKIIFKGRTHGKNMDNNNGE
jgi:hypothetical protein